MIQQGLEAVLNLRTPASACGPQRRTAPFLINLVGWAPGIRLGLFPERDKDIACILQSPVKPTIPPHLSSSVTKPRLVSEW